MERASSLAALRRDHTTRCEICAAVVMDDHVHVLFRVFQDVTAGRLVQAWKSISSHEICRASPRTAPLRQAEYYQRWVASPRLIPICAEYIRQNPGRRWPGIGEHEWMLP